MVIKKLVILADHIFKSKLSHLELESKLENKKGKSTGATGDIMLRDLDCYIIEAIHDMYDNSNDFPRFDSVRAGFWEGDELYPNAGFRKKNHIQISVRSEQNIIAYFKPIT